MSLGQAVNKRGHTDDNRAKDLTQLYMLNISDLSLRKPQGTPFVPAPSSLVRIWVLAWQLVLCSFTMLMLLCKLRSQHALPLCHAMCNGPDVAGAGRLTLVDFTVEYR